MPPTSLRNPFPLWLTLIQMPPTSFRNPLSLWLTLIQMPPTSFRNPLSLWFLSIPATRTLEAFTAHCVSPVRKHCILAYFLCIQCLSCLLVCESEEYISTIKTQINMRSLTGQSFVLAWHPILLLRKMNQIKSERGVGGVGGGRWLGREG